MAEVNMCIMCAKVERCSMHRKDPDSIVVDCGRFVISEENAAVMDAVKEGIAQDILRR